MRQTCVGSQMLRMNSTEEQVRWIVGSKPCPLGIVNPPHRKKPAQASFIAALKLRLPLRLRSLGTEASFQRIVRVMGSLGV